MILENVHLPLFLKKTVSAAEKPPFELKTGRPKFDLDQPFEQRAESEEVFAAQLKEKLKPIHARHILDYAVLALQQDLEFSPEDDDRLVDAVLDVIVGVTFPLRSLFTEKQVEEFCNRLSLELVSNDEKYLAKASSRTDRPTLFVNLRTVLGAVKENYFNLSMLGDNLRPLPLTPREYCRLLGAHEGGHFLWSFSRANVLRKKIKKTYVSPASLPKEELDRYRNHPMERRANLWQNKYAKLFLDDQSVPVEERLSSTLIESTRPKRMDETQEFVVPAEWQTSD